jgi:hypothetical protein
MAYSAFTAGEIAIKQSLKHSLWQKIKDNFDAVYGLTAPGAGILGVPNFSMEIDSDADGIPDNWTKTLFPGGSGSITTNSFHGASAYLFVHPGGVSNGGGVLTSDYFEISEFVSPLVQFGTYSTAAGMKNAVSLMYYDRAKAYISSEDAWLSVANPASWTAYVIWGQPPATARYCKLALIGGYTDTNVAGTVVFDVGLIDPFPRLIPTYFTSTQYTTYSATWVDVASWSINVPKGFSFLSFNAQLAALDSGTTSAGLRFRIGGVYSNILEMTALTHWHTWPFELAIPTVPGAQTLYMQAHGDGAQQGYVIKSTGIGQYARLAGMA